MFRYLVRMAKSDGGFYVADFVSPSISAEATIRGGVKNEIEGGMVLANIKAHRQVSFLVEDDNFNHALMLLRRDDKLNIDITLDRYTKTSDVAIANVRITKCQLMSLTPSAKGGIAFFKVNGTFAMETEDEN